MREVKSARLDTGEIWASLNPGFLEHESNQQLTCLLKPEKSLIQISAPEKGAFQ